MNEAARIPHITKLLANGPIVEGKPGWIDSINTGVEIKEVRAASVLDDCECEADGEAEVGLRKCQLSAAVRHQTIRGSYTPTDAGTSIGFRGPVLQKVEDEVESLECLQSGEINGEIAAIVCDFLNCGDREDTTHRQLTSDVRLGLGGEDLAH